MTPDYWMRKAKMCSRSELTPRLQEEAMGQQMRSRAPVINVGKVSMHDRTVSFLWHFH